MKTELRAPVPGAVFLRECTFGPGDNRNPASAMRMPPLARAFQ